MSNMNPAYNIQPNMKEITLLNETRGDIYFLIYFVYLFMCLDLTYTGSNNPYLVFQIIFISSHNSSIYF